MKAHPEETRQRARELRALGETYVSIAKTLGVSTQAVMRWVKPEYAAQQRAYSNARKEKLRGRCADCGGPTSYSGKNGLVSALRCKWCAQGKTPPPAPDKRRTVPVRLCDISEEARLEAAREANRYAESEEERIEILLAALAPSDEVYWLSESARDMLVEKVAA